MAHADRTRTRRRSVPVLLAALLLTALIAFLISKIYQSQVKLQDLALANLHQDLENRAAAFGFLFLERKNDFEDLTESKVISVFFENRALGMSMEYGLKASLIGIQDLFFKLLRDRKFGNEQAYDRILFLDDSGRVMVDSLTGILNSEAGADWKRFLAPGSRVPQIIVEFDGDSPVVIISSAYYFKNVYAGQILAWIPMASIYDNLLMQHKSSAKRLYYFSYLGNGSEVPFQPKAGDGFCPRTTLPMSPLIKAETLRSLPRRETVASSWLFGPSSPARPSGW